MLFQGTYYTILSLISAYTVSMITVKLHNKTKFKDYLSGLN